MKAYLVFLLLLTCRISVADVLSTKDGVVYKNVVIVSAQPERMLIVHDGGGCQVDFKDLVPDSLTTDQRKQVETFIRDYAERNARKEKLRMEREAFELTQREKGLDSFEGIWLTPVDRETILLKREKERLERERMELELAKEKVRLEKELLETEKAKYLLDGESSRDSYLIVGGFSSYDYRKRSKFDAVYGCRTPSIHNHRKVGGVYYRQPYPSRAGVSCFNPGPFNR